MLSSIKIKNLGCFDDQAYSVSFNKLNVIVGPNNSGKSMLMKGLNMIRIFSYHNQLNWNNEYFSLENNHEAVYTHDMNRIIELTAQYKEGTNSFEARLFIKNDKVVRDEFLKNGNAAGQLIHNDHKNLVSQIWYFHPERSHIPFQSEIGMSTSGIQPIAPTGYNVIQYLLERFNARDNRYNDAEYWLKEIDRNITLLKTPITSKSTSLVTDRTYGKTSTEVNMSLQGSGINNVTTIIAGIIFSPPNSTIIIEEPENFLHRESIELLVDLFNLAVNDLSKQIIVTTHSWGIIRAYAQDIGKAPKRGHRHTKAKPEDFKLIEFNNTLGKEKIQEYPLKDKEYEDVIDHFIGL